MCPSTSPRRGRPAGRSSSSASAPVGSLCRRRPPASPSSAWTPRSGCWTSAAAMRRKPVSSSCSTFAWATSRTTRQRARLARHLSVPVHLHLTDTPARLAALRAARDLLLPGGRFIFDVFAPYRDDIEETHGRWIEREPGIFERADWDPEERTLQLRARPGRGVDDAARLDQRRRVAPGARGGGLRGRTVYGWFDYRPFTRQEDMIFVARRASLKVSRLSTTA